MKKFLTMLLALTLLVGCMVPTAMAEGDMIELTVWHTWGAGGGLDAMNMADRCRRVLPSPVFLDAFNGAQA